MFYPVKSEARTLVDRNSFSMKKER